MNHEDSSKAKTPTWLIVCTLGLAALVKLLVVVWGLSRAKWDLDAPVPFRVFVLVSLVELGALAFLLIKLLF